MTATVLDKSVPEELAPPLDATAEHPPPLFDGTTRLYTCYTSPFAQRVWIIRNFKGLQDEIKLVALNLQNRPTWYGEKVYPLNKVPAFEHNGKIIGESLDMITYVDTNFEGPSLLPDDPVKKEFAEELFAYADTFLKIVFGSFKGDPAKDASPAFDYLENALHKFDDGPFFLGQFSVADIAHIADIFLSDVFKYDMSVGRPKLAAWIEELNKIEAYKQTRTDPKELVEHYKRLFLANAVSGMAVHDECISKFLELKAKRTYRFVVFKIEEKQKQVIVEKLGEPAQTYDDFAASLPADECRYAVYDFDFVTVENCQKSRIFFIAWCPDTARVRSKMIYASTKDTFRRVLDGIQVELQATDPTEMGLDVFKSRAN